MKEKCLITGSCGFIGSHLIQRLTERGCKPVPLAREALSSMDVLKKTLREERPEIIFHLAAYGNHYQQTDVGEIFRANLVGTFNLLEAAMETGFRAFVNTGSSSEYGKQMRPMAEDMLPETDTFYGATKVGATFLVRAFARQLGLPIVTVRPFSVYGPREAANRFIPTAIRCALSGEELTLAPGVHDWIFVDDFVDGMILVSESAASLSGEVVNIGSGVQYTNEEVVRAIEQATGKVLNIKTTDRLRVYDTETMWVADNKVLCGLGWQPRYDLLEGIKKTVDAIRADS
ncbi:hypothetical protein A3J19_04990 [Candidatus Daviesbacteria bacterium RIFCSPLOWO2_02_FULL_41_8]|uniref:NAD-dependent epimerase/dehydratase domain-containing protein n=1 Tax=Candidatus Daviesbacteria bacterium RIFCSPLOWO2_02_FULL_41_8 TaxID=1797798 RepID=A0A1F5NIY8_9BACT|nr:MAG: hypothetical protein A3J19_04990 [Candidatus Daviesbacteria bacterium RIFCSPLOWO2_02_FULL_41_8]